MVTIYWVGPIKSVCTPVAEGTHADVPGEQGVFAGDICMTWLAYSKNSAT